MNILTALELFCSRYSPKPFLLDGYVFATNPFILIRVPYASHLANLKLAACQEQSLINAIRTQLDFSTKEKVLTPCRNPRKYEWEVCLCVGDLGTYCGDCFRGWRLSTKGVLQHTGIILHQEVLYKLHQIEASEQWLPRVEDHHPHLTGYFRFRNGDGVFMRMEPFAELLEPAR